jgi:hypothetical protein
LLTTACDDFFEKDISDKNVEVIVPADNTTVPAGAVTFFWNELEHASAYRLRIVSPNFQNAATCACDTLLNDSLSANNRLTVTLPAGTYQWSIQAENSAYQSLTKILSLQVNAADEEQ